MQIHELPIGTPTDDDVLAIDNGLSTRKAAFSQFEAGGNPVTFESEDTEEPTGWQEADVLESGSLGELFEGLSKIAANVRFVKSHFLEPVEIPSDADINDYTDAGNYACSGAAVAQTHTHAPFTDASYQMLVFAYGDTRMQIAWKNSVTTPITYRAKYEDGTWGSWTQLAKAVDVDPIGTIVTSNTMSGTKSIATATATNLTSISLTAGKWLVTGSVAFNAGGNAGTYRKGMIGSNTTNDAYVSEQVGGVEYLTTTVNMATVVELSSASNVYLNCQQGSGSSITAALGGCKIKAIRIK